MPTGRAVFHVEPGASGTTITPSGTCANHQPVRLTVRARLVEERVACPNLPYVVRIHHRVLGKVRPLTVDLERILVVEEFDVEALAVHPATLPLSMCYIVIHGTHHRDAGRRSPPGRRQALHPRRPVGSHHGCELPRSAPVHGCGPG